MKWLRPIIYGGLCLGLLVFATLMRPGFWWSTHVRAPSVAAKTQISNFKTVIDSFKIDNGDYPKSLKDLVVEPQGLPNWHGPYLEGRSIPVDPWGRPFHYTFPGQHNTNSFDLMSAGFDGRAGTDDDITNWQPKL